MPGRSVTDATPSEESRALREVVAPTGFMSFGQYLAIRRQVRRQLLASSFGDIHGKDKAKEPEGKQGDEGGGQGQGEAT